MNSTLERKITPQYLCIWLRNFKLKIFYNKKLCKIIFIVVMLKQSEHVHTRKCTYSRAKEKRWKRSLIYQRKQYSYK